MGYNIGRTKEGINNFDLTTGSFGTKTNHKEEKITPTAIIYCRVSDRSQVDEGHGLEGQETVCKQRCKTQNPPIEVLRVFKEPGVSGSEMNREYLNKAMDFLKENNKGSTRVTHFVVSEASRISRPNNIIEAFSLEEKIKAYGVKIIKVDSVGLDDSTDEGHLFKTFQYAIAGYERQKIAQRVHNGKRSRLLAGYRPFNKPPLGYKRRVLSKKQYIDEIDSIRGPIITEGLNFFANNILETQSDLLKFFKKQGLTMNDSKNSKIQRTLVGKMMSLNRLFFYAGLIIYPSRDINIPVEGKHESLITVKTLYKIVKKLKVQSRYTNMRYNSKKKLTDEHPLRGAIVCPSCNQMFTSWNTTKMVGKGENKTKKFYPYYGCSNINCRDRQYIKKSQLEEEFNDLLNQITVKPKVSKVIRLTFESNWNSNRALREQLVQEQKSQLESLKRKLSLVEEKLISCTNLNLQELYEKEWQTVKNRIDELTSCKTEQDEVEFNLEQLLQKALDIFENPLTIRGIGNPDLRRRMLTVRFNGSLTYKKKLVPKTVPNPGSLNVLEDIPRLNASLCTEREKHKTMPIEFVKKLTRFLNEMSDEIEAAIYLWNEAKSKNQIDTED